MNIRLTGARQEVLLSLPIEASEFTRNERRVARRLVGEGLVKLNRKGLFALTFQGRKIVASLD